ncbi:HAMP domain-containing protein [Erythrobacter aquimaris]|uniref:histidine kinase n=1 Tax=Qipengyuania aquimaris TaxID=255984 RepID=A0A6I4TLI9_9SPHN|nr:ATP-binding protein [Qipengyuania aquimaris]MXO96656.1 HAMP domain-containing protein [Qipengyuania aquimaris]
MRFLPKSLLGQTLLAVAGALLLAQLVTTGLLYRIAEERREEALISAAQLSLWGAPVFRQARGEAVLEGDRRRFRADRRELGGRWMRGEVTEAYPLLPGETSDDALATAIAARLTGFVREPHAVLATIRSTDDDPVVMQRVRDWNPASRKMVRGYRKVFVAAVQWEEGGAWHVARVPFPRDDRRVFLVTAAQTLVIFILVMTVLFVLLRRITRPLARLTRQTERFSSNPGSITPIEPSGPDDIRSLIAAHNAMEARIAAMLDEKDVMLGAIGHDLKTPLAALRVRIEAIRDDGLRAKMAQSIEEITQTLDEILLLARIGRADRPAERTDLYALLVSVVEEFEDMNQPVALLEGQRVPAPVHLTWLKRGVRNLISNALRYGGTAEIALLREGDEAVIRVEDDGPGIPEDRIAEMLEPFTRGEASRNRATGGAGLGLTITRAVAEQHGGSLVLENRQQGGLRAELRLPI